MKSGDNCFCGSGCIFGECCGKVVGRMDRRLAYTALGTTESIRFVVEYYPEGGLLREGEKVLVFDNRAEALAFADDQDVTRGFKIIGMNVDHWAKFKERFQWQDAP